MLYKETVEVRTLDLILRLIKDEMFKEFDLAGDTALSLQIGHRLSADIELGSKSSFDAILLSDHLAKKYKAESIKTLKNRVECLVEEVKVDLRSHQYLLAPPVIIEEIRMISQEDIGAIKLKAIVDGENSFKDFIDIYSLLEHSSLEELTEAYEKKYTKVNRSMVHKALMNHNDIIPASVTLTGQEITMKDIAYRFKKAILEPKRIFESVPWQRQTLKKTKGDKRSPDKSRGKGWHQ
ncbi:MAG TPA: hypothetical protein VF939_14320 [Puia sp.]